MPQEECYYPHIFHVPQGGSATDGEPFPEYEKREILTVFEAGEVFDEYVRKALIEKEEPDIIKDGVKFDAGWVFLG